MALLVARITHSSHRGFMELEDEDRGTVDAQGSSGGGGEGLQAEPAKDGGAGDGQASQDPGTEDVEEDREERYNPRKAARKAKIEAIWESLKRDGQFCGRKSCAPSSAGVLQTANFGGAAKLSSGYKAGMSLASLCQPVKDVPPSVDPDKVIVRVGNPRTEHGFLCLWLLMLLSDAWLAALDGRLGHGEDGQGAHLPDSICGGSAAC